ncbi:ABC transporter permease [Bacillus sp. FJAT-49705]|uniref:ABC transporter permease n=1 Tax=Cytobacillus citreus TaxID=2833586 RepID=A0ABS5NTT7_9BACI|nr:ABC transporter permease [Cytobacillus citreus]MBS4191252.1 ABC transporter permease [Cytobacillus citreus]
MTNLIRAELYKLSRNKTFWVLITSLTGFSALLHLLIILDWWQLSGTEFDKAQLSDLNALSTFTIPLFFNIIVSTLAGFYISTEFSQSGVIKNQMMSGNKRANIFMAKYLVFSLGAFIVTILIPLITAFILIIFFGQGDTLSPTNLMYLARAYGLFTLQFLSFTGIVLLIAIVTEDSGKTILFPLLLSIVMFAIEKLITVPFIKMMYENTIFYQFSEAFKYTLTSGEMIKSIFIGVISLIIIIFLGIFMVNRKEIK